jgi:hypothetical protein
LLEETDQLCLILPTLFPLVQNHVCGCQISVQRKPKHNTQFPKRKVDRFIVLVFSFVFGFVFCFLLFSSSQLLVLVSQPQPQPEQGLIRLQEPVSMEGEPHGIAPNRQDVREAVPPGTVAKSTVFSEKPEGLLCSIPEYRGESCRFPNPNAQYDDVLRSGEFQPAHVQPAQSPMQPLHRGADLIRSQCKLDRVTGRKQLNPAAYNTGSDAIRHALQCH